MVHLLWDVSLSSNQRFKGGLMDIFKAQGLKGHLPLHSFHFATGCSKEKIGGNQVLIFLINYICVHLEIRVPFESGRRAATILIAL
jgi:hypothetical protein